MPSKCPEKKRQAQKRWYEKNKATHYQNVRRNKLAAQAVAREWRTEYLKENPCVDCGESDAIVLEFDHVRDSKSFMVSTAVQDGYSLDSIKKEVAKCDVRCANCHRRVTHKRRLDL